MLIPRNLRGAQTREDGIIAATVIAFSGHPDDFDNAGRHVSDLTEENIHEAHLAIQAYYESLTFATGTMIEPSHARIDHGRVETLKRREKFATLSVVAHHWANINLKVSNKALLSPRRLYREYIEQHPAAGQTALSRGSVVNFVGGVINMNYKLMCDWREAGYPLIDDDAFLPFSGQVAGWTVRLVQS